MWFHHLSPKSPQHQVTNPLRGGPQLPLRPAVPAANVQQRDPPFEAGAIAQRHAAADAFVALPVLDLQNWHLAAAREAPHLGRVAADVRADVHVAGEDVDAWDGRVEMKGVAIGHQE